MDKFYDIIIVGAGPAGLTAGIYARRANKSALIIEKNNIGGQMNYSPKIENYPGFENISGEKLSLDMFNHAMEQGCDIEFENVVGIHDNGEIKTVITDLSSYDCRAIILATGAKHRMLGVPKEEDFIGRGISFCAVCDGAFYKNKDVVVIGGGNSALQEANLLADTCKSVTLIQNLDHFTGEEILLNNLKSKKNVNFKTGLTVTGLKIIDNIFCGLRLSDGTEQHCDGVFVAIGLIPDASDFSTTVKLTDYGYIMTDYLCHTNVNGIYAAGDVRDKTIRQITTATADGATAAIFACKYVDTFI